MGSESNDWLALPDSKSKCTTQESAVKAGMTDTEGSYTHLGRGEREQMIRLRCQGHSNRSIGRILKRSHTTIAREFARNVHDNGDHIYYTYSKAHEKAMERRSVARRKSQFSPEDWKIVEDAIRENWSPEQVSKTPEIRNVVSMCHETIYNHIYKDKRQGGSLYLHLRLRCRKHRKRYRSKDSRGILRGKTMINQRPQDIQDRLTVGHWEIDTVMGKGGKDCIVTLVERRTRFLWIGKLKERTVACLNAAVIRFILTTPYPVLSITSDNGTEFHGYAGIEKATGVKFYFAQPHHAWERGTNENTNGLIRQYLPKGNSMAGVTQGMCDIIAKHINTRPRKTLQYRTPIKAWVGEVV
jgi:transposase, IS30 family